jgi:hypothetical protein
MHEASTASRREQRQRPRRSQPCSTPAPMMIAAISLVVVVVAGSWERAAAHSELPAVSLPYPRSKIPTGQAGLTLFAVSEANISSSEFGDSGRVTLATLAGVLARHSPQIYTLKAGAALTPAALQPNGDTTPLWLDDLQTHHGLKFSLKYLADLKGLLRLFASSGKVASFVSYDVTAAACKGICTNAALTRAAASERSIVSGTAAMTEFLKSLGLTQLADATASTPSAEYARGRASLSHRGVISQPNDGGKANCLASYAVFARFPTIEDKDAGFQTVLRDFNRSNGQLSVAYGWTNVDEHTFTAGVTAAGGYVHASDFAYNLAFLSNMPPFQAPPPPPPSPLPAPVKKGVHTVAFVMSDGDNIQLLQNDWMSVEHWNHPARGTVAAGWSYSPAMAQLMPSVLSYVHRTASSNDSLSTGPSGAGYCEPAVSILESVHID